ncbi:uncharacterized protein LOC129794149 [Lutzomyia longipalpis]|uniref:uncharacterized protein LOC129794149 n=1 Tax=Lutzomyia longipalpis TaxID=7200 RepID=UPI0024834AB0|nr:uncharacterized protein LOC129794149 [Lutzomyia longipalpis]XP_055690764.1 uncharacterized protein LOC129794149 [Lutzomyia longipalpis]
MDDMFLQCNKNAIYVLNSSYRYGEYDMINLFGSPAGRALNSSKTPQTSPQPLPAISPTAYPPLPGHRSISNDEGEAAAAKSSKKTSIFKSSNIAAKKCKFWKFLEDEKLKKNSVEDLSTTSSGQSSSSRWRKSNRKSSTELYREAAQLLGLSCTLSDNCRCMDCQSRYFDCDDSDTYSDHSFRVDFGCPEDTLTGDVSERADPGNGALWASSDCRDKYCTSGGCEELSNSESVSDLSVDEEAHCSPVAVT